MIFHSLEPLSLENGNSIAQEYPSLNIFDGESMILKSQKDSEFFREKAVLSSQFFGEMESYQQQSLLSQDSNFGFRMKDLLMAPMNCEQQQSQHNKLLFKGANLSEIVRRDQIGTTDGVDKNSVEKERTKKSSFEKNSVDSLSVQKPIAKKYAKDYRQRKKKYIKDLQEQNKFLKHKINQLSYRLNETNFELNRIKNSQQQLLQTSLNTPHQFQVSSLQREKGKFKARIEVMLQQQRRAQGPSSNGNLFTAEVIKDLELKINELTAFDGKEKMQKVNYHMTEVFEHLIHDSSCYLIECLEKERGIWSPKSRQTFMAQSMGSIDRQILEAVGVYDGCQKGDLVSRQKIQQIKDSISPFMKKELLKFKSYCRNLYQCYLEIVRQGNLVSKYIEQLTMEWKKYSSDFIVIELFLYFEKVKYRKDMRRIREEWMLSLMAKDK